MVSVKAISEQPVSVKSVYCSALKGVRTVEWNEETRSNKQAAGLPEMTLEQ